MIQKKKSRWHNLFQPYSNGILIFSGKSKTYLRGLGNELSVQRRWLGLFSIFYFYTSCGYNSIKSEIKDTLNVQNTWTVKLPKICIYKIRRKKSIREINVPAVSTAVTVDTWRAFKDPTLVLRLKYLTRLWTNNDLWLYGICKLPDLTLLSSTAEILIFGTPRLPETEAKISLLMKPAKNKISTKPHLWSLFTRHNQVLYTLNPKDSSTRFSTNSKT